MPGVHVNSRHKLHRKTLLAGIDGLTWDLFNLLGDSGVMNHPDFSVEVKVKDGDGAEAFSLKMGSGRGVLDAVRQYQATAWKEMSIRFTSETVREVKAVLTREMRGKFVTSPSLRITAMVGGARHECGDVCPAAVQSRGERHDPWCATRRDLSRIAVAFLTLLYAGQHSFFQEYRFGRGFDHHAFRECSYDPFSCTWT